MTTARLAAARVLVAVERGRTTLAAEVERARRGLAADRDRGFFLEITAGTLRWRDELDALLSACSRRPTGALDADVRAIVRLGAYQLEHLTRVPAHAVVHESVELARRMGHPRAAGFVNAVLRTLARRRGTIALPPRPTPDRPREQQLAYLTIALSHPEWLASRWLDRHGFDAAERWCRFNNDPPQITIRRSGTSGADLLREIAAAGIAAEPARFVHDAVRLPAGALSQLPADLRQGAVVQDEASQIVAHAAGVHPGERVLDLCASPGGKTTLLSADMTQQGLLVASDFRAARVALLAATLRRAAVRAPIVRLDATRPLPFEAVFDCVVVDVPCTGLGTLRGNPDIKWSRQPDDLVAYAAVEEAILNTAARCVRAGGRLVYATCSSEPEENEAVVDRFLSRHPGFRLEPVTFGEAVIGGEGFVDDRGHLRTLPFRDGLDAFFAAALRRER